MNALLRWLRHFSASDTAVRAVEESLLDWKHEVGEAPGVLCAFASDFLMATGIGRLTARVIAHDVADALMKGWWLRLIGWTLALVVGLGLGAFAVTVFGEPNRTTREASRTASEEARTPTNADRTSGTPRMLYRL